MCYNPPMAFTLFGIGVALSAYIKVFKPVLARTHIVMILVFYSLMELLQGVQYYWVNECSSKVNKYLTEVAYAFVVIQPFLWNLFFYLNSDGCEKHIFKTAMVLSLLWVFFNVAARVTYKNPGIDDQTPQMSVFASDKVCTRKKATHLYWTWTSANFFDFTATYLFHLMFWFVPALLTRKHRMSSIILMASAVVSIMIGYALGEPFTFTSAWCYVSIPVVILVLINIMFQSNRW